MNEDKRKQAVQWIATWMGDHDVVLCERAYAELLDHITASTAHTESAAPVIDEAQIKHMIDRFLGWYLPDDFSPDAGISFKKTFNENSACGPMEHKPSGTNLLSGVQAEAMVRYMVAGMPAPSPVSGTDELADQVTELIAQLHDRADLDQEAADKIDPEHYTPDDPVDVAAGLEFQALEYRRCADMLERQSALIAEQGHRISAYMVELEARAASTSHTGSAAPEASQQLAETVLSMQMTTDKGLVARRLARQVLGIDEQGRGPDLVPITTNGTTRLIPRDEPVFLIRGQDAAGAATVRAWADMADALGADSEILRVAREHADKMDVWPKKKTADLPQGSPSPSPAPSPVSDAHERAAKVCRERAKKQPNLDMKFVAIDCERDIRALAGKE